MLISQLKEPAKTEAMKPLDEKIKLSKKVIDNFITLYSGECVISCSFGKDSMVVLYLIRQFDKNVAVLFSNTLCQYLETYQFRDKIVKQWNLNYYETKPVNDWTFYKIAEKYGLPDGNKGSDHCCDRLKEIPFRNLIKEKGWKINFTGMTALESRNRMFIICNRGQDYYSKKDTITRVHPIAYWTENDVWAFIEREEIPINPAYEMYSIPRLGCVPCTAHKKWREQLASVNLKLYAKISEDYFNLPLLDRYLDGSSLSTPTGEKNE